MASVQEFLTTLSVDSPIIIIISHKVSPFTDISRSPRQACLSFPFTLFFHQQSISQRLMTSSETFKSADTLHCFLQHEMLTPLSKMMASSAACKSQCNSTFSFAESCKSISQSLMISTETCKPPHKLYHFLCQDLSINACLAA